MHRQLNGWKMCKKLAQSGVRVQKGHYHHSVPYDMHTLLNTCHQWAKVRCQKKRLLSSDAASLKLYKYSSYVNINYRSTDIHTNLLDWLAKAEIPFSTNCKWKSKKFRKDRQIFTVNTIRNFAKVMFPKRLLSRIERAMICRHQLNNKKGDEWEIPP